jgi:diguanylate cyclase (GGDEF)-like protein
MDEMKRNADDITERKSSIAEGVELKITPDEMLMRLADGIAIVLENGKVAFINPSGAEIMGRPASEIVGRPLQHTVSPGPPTEMEVHGTQGETTLVEVRTEEIGWAGDTAYLCSLRDISQRKQAERTMQRQVQTERMVASLSGLFLNLDPESTVYAIDESLRRLGDFCRVDRCVLFLLSNDLTVFFPFKEWADLGQESPGGMDQSISVENVPWFWDRLTIFETVLIDTPGSLPSEAKAERDWLAGRSTRSLVAVAVTNGPDPIGFLAFEAVRDDRVWNEDEIGLLKVAGEIIAKAISHAEEHVEGMAAQKILDALMEGCPSGVLVEDESRKVIRTNGKLSEMFDLFDSHSLVPGMPALDLLGEIGTIFESSDEFIARTQELVAAASDVTDERFNLCDGRSVSVTYRSIGVNEQKKRHFWQFSDVTVEDKDEKNLASYIRRDVLTGFSNRPRLMEDMKFVIQEAAEDIEAGEARFMALLLLDLDDFRSVNTTLGLESGDAVLRQAAERIRNCVQGSDLLGRIGGDGFGILLTSPKDTAEVEHVGRRIVWSIGQPFEVDAHVVQIGVSIGICLYPDQGDEVQALFQRADMALLQAKEQGRGNLQVFDKVVCRLTE